MKAFLAVHGTQGAASASVRETVDGLTESGGARAAAFAPGRRHLPHRGRAGPGRTGPDARRPPRGGARLRAVPRAPLPGARAAGPSQPRRPRRPRCTSSTAASACRWTMRALQGLVESACAGLGADVKAEPILAETRRNLYDGVPIDEVYKAAILAARTLIEKEPGYTRATARLLLHTIRREILGERGDAGRDGRALCRVLPRLHQEGRRRRAARRQAAAVRPGSAWARRSTPSATCSSTTSACRRCTTATSCTSTRRASRCRRPSSCAWRWAWR